MQREQISASLAVHAVPIAGMPLLQVHVYGVHAFELSNWNVPVQVEQISALFAVHSVVAATPLLQEQVFAVHVFELSKWEFPVQLEKSSCRLPISTLKLCAAHIEMSKIWVIFIVSCV
jgi:hypothetical protein